MSVDTASPLTVSSGSADGSPETVSRSFDILGRRRSPEPEPGARALPRHRHAAGAARDDRRRRDPAGGGVGRRSAARFLRRVPLQPAVDDLLAEPARRRRLPRGRRLRRDSFHAVRRRRAGRHRSRRRARAARARRRRAEPDRASAPAARRDLFDPGDLAAPGLLPARRRDQRLERHAAVAACWRPAPAHWCSPDRPGRACCRACRRFRPRRRACSTWRRRRRRWTSSWTMLPEAAHIALVNQEVERGRPTPVPASSWRGRGASSGSPIARPSSRPIWRSACSRATPIRTSAGKAQNSAAYIEIGGDADNPIPVAIIADTDPYIEGLRADIRPEGPELDGIIGAGVLGARARRDRLPQQQHARDLLVRRRDEPADLLDRRALPAAARPVDAARLLQPAARRVARDVRRRHVRGELGRHAGGDLTVPDAGGRAAAGAGADAAAAAAARAAAAAGAPRRPRCGWRSPTSRSRGARRRRWRCSCRTASCSGWCARACRWSTRSMPAASSRRSRSWRAAIRRPA